MVLSCTEVLFMFCMQRWPWWFNTLLIFGHHLPLWLLNSTDLCLTSCTISLPFWSCSNSSTSLFRLWSNSSLSLSPRLGFWEVLSARDLRFLRTVLSVLGDDEFVGDKEMALVLWCASVKVVVSKDKEEAMLGECWWDSRCKVKVYLVKIKDESFSLSLLVLLSHSSPFFSSSLFLKFKLKVKIKQQQVSTIKPQ